MVVVVDILAVVFDAIIQLQLWFWYQRCRNRCVAVGVIRRSSHLCRAVIAIISENVTIPFAKGEPLFTMVSKRYKTTDIVGYLKSILEDAKPYARMKLMFVGIQGIGKTSLLNRLKEEGMNAAR